MFRRYPGGFISSLVRFQFPRLLYTLVAFEVKNLLFNSYIFVLLFLPLAFVGYFLINKRSLTFGKIWLLGMSLWFYAYFNIKYLPILVISICFNYTMSKIIMRTNIYNRKKVLLIFAIIVNIGVLGYFKYYNFFIENINTAFHVSFTFHHMILPLAISFFTFQHLSYIIDSFKGETPDYALLDFAAYMAFFPQLVSGPIVRHDEMIPQLTDISRKRVNYNNLSKGIMAFSFGLAKKVLLADTFAGAVNWGFGNIASLDTTNALLILLFYTFQIYFDFSGYCDMATGIGLVFNIELPMNFNSPYRALTITDFWKRWHITLTRFFTRYVYIPMGGSRKGTVRTYLNILIVFLISGLWHGANWTFILWGGMHGAFSLITRLLRKWIDKLHPVLNWLITFGFVNFARIYFRADSIGVANLMLSNILKFNFGSINADIASAFYLTEFEAISTVFGIGILSNPILYLLLFSIFSLFAVVFMKNTNERLDSHKPTMRSAIISIVLLVWCILSFSGVSTFVYLDF